MKKVKEVSGVFACFIAIGLSSGAMSPVVTGIVSLLGLGTALTVWFKEESF